MKVLVVGGTRFIGPYAVRRLAEAGHEIAVFHRGRTGAELPEGVGRIPGDRRNLGDFADEFRRFAPEGVLDMIPMYEEDARVVVAVFRDVARRVVAISSEDVYRAYDLVRGPGPALRGCRVRSPEPLVWARVGNPRGEPGAKLGKILRNVMVAGLVVAALAFLRQRRRPIPHPPPLTFLFENPIVGAVVGPEILIRRLSLAPGMRVLDAGCGPGRLTIPLARAVRPTGEVVALDGQRAMLAKLEERLRAEGITNVRTLLSGLGEGALRGPFDRVLLAMVLGEVRDREAAVRELYAALRPGGILSVTEVFGDPDYRRPATVRREVEVAGFHLVEHYGGFPGYTLNFAKPGALRAEEASPESLAL